MKLAISCRVPAEYLKHTIVLCGRQLELHTGGPDGTYLALVEEFGSFEEGRPFIEAVRDIMRTCSSSSLDIYVRERGDTFFISLNKFACICERVRRTVSQKQAPYLTNGGLKLVSNG